MVSAGFTPQVDLATEPRWSRIGATFGEDANLTSELAVAYVRGFQGTEVGPTSVSTMTKHFSGGGPIWTGRIPTSRTAESRSTQAITRSTTSNNSRP